MRSSRSQRAPPSGTSRRLSGGAAAARSAATPATTAHGVRAFHTADREPYERRKASLVLVTSPAARALAGETHTKPARRRTGGPREARDARVHQPRALAPQLLLERERVLLALALLGREQLDLSQSSATTTTPRRTARRQTTETSVEREKERPAAQRVSTRSGTSNDAEEPSRAERNRGGRGAGAARRVATLGRDGRPGQEESRRATPRRGARLGRGGLAVAASDRWHHRARAIDRLLPST